MVCDPCAHNLGVCSTVTINSVNLLDIVIFAINVIVLVTIIIDKISM